MGKKFNDFSYKKKLRKIYKLNPSKFKKNSSQEMEKKINVIFLTKKILRKIYKFNF